MCTNAKSNGTATMTTNGTGFKTFNDKADESPGCSDCTKVGDMSASMGLTFKRSLDDTH